MGQVFAETALPSFATVEPSRRSATNGKILAANDDRTPVDICQSRNVGRWRKSKEFPVVGIFRDTRRFTDFLERSGVNQLVDPLTHR